MNRRHFIWRAGVAAGLGNQVTASAARGVSIVIHPNDVIASSTPATWAASELQKALSAKGVPVRMHDAVAQAQPGDLIILAAGAAAPLSREILGAAKASVPDAPEV